MYLKRIILFIVLISLASGCANQNMEKKKESKGTEQTKLSYKVLDKLPIRSKMLNAVDHYRTISGSFELYNKPLLNNSETISFAIQEGKNPRSWVSVATDSNISLRTVFDGKFAVIINNQNKSFIKTRMDNTPIPKSPRISLNKSDEWINIYRNDPAGANIANEVTFPQVYAFWLKNHFKVIGQEKLFKRDAEVITGDVPLELKKKRESVTYKMWVDKKTGILLKMIEKNARGTVTNSIIIKRLEINHALNEKMFKLLKKPKNYKNLNVSSNR